MDQKILHLFTASFPLEMVPEMIFVLGEIRTLSNHFDQVKIYPGVSGTKALVDLPNNVEVCFVPFDQSVEVKLSVSDHILISKLILHELKVNRFARSFNKARELRARLVNIVKKGKLLDKHFVFAEKDTCYTFWWEEWNFSLSYLKHIKKINNKIVSKVHGFDLFDERSKFGKIPFRDFQLKYTEKVFSISEKGCQYLKSKYPSQSAKFEVSRLGTFDLGMNPLQDYNETIVLVSCSSMVPIKQLHLIPKILSKVNSKVKWIHFGEGVCRSDIELQISNLPQNIEVLLKGYTPNDEVLKYYRENPISAFINVSESEGIPVSMMEAISFGLPLIGFDVGGIREIVTSATGILVAPFELETIESILNDFWRTQISQHEFRMGVRDFWKQHFSAETNSLGFVNRLDQV